MKRTINFIGRRGEYNIPSFPVIDNEHLTLKLEGLENRGKYRFTIKHGDKQKVVHLKKGHTVDIPAEWFKGDKTSPIECFLELLDDTGTQVLIQSANSFTDTLGYFIEPLKIEKVNEKWSLVPWLEKTERIMAEIQADIKSMQATLAEYQESGIPLKFED